MKVLIFGSDYGTLDLVREAHNEGDYVVAADFTPVTPTKQAADEAHLISTHDVDAFEKFCKEQKIEAITFGASDSNITYGRQLVKRLGLPLYCESDTAWKAGRNKRFFKDVCKEVGAPVSPDYKVSMKPSREELDKLVYPVVVKPIDCSANRGMSYCKNETELLAAIEKVKDFSKEPFIVERELHGPEFAVNYVMTDGHIQLLYFSSEHSQPGQKDNMYSLICTTSCHLKQYLAEVNHKVIEVFKKIGCREGNAWVECMLDRDGHFYILEMGYRFGGEMTVMPYEKVCGFNTVKFMLDIAKGVKHKVSDLPEPLNKAYREIAASYHLFICKEGNIAKIEGVEEVKKIPNVYVDMPKVVGSFSKLGLTMGIIRIFAHDADELCNIIAKINSVLKITDAEGDNMFVYFDDFESIKQEYEQGIKEFEK